jgi:hypothetical protein
MRGAKGCEWRVFLERRLGGLNKSTADALTAVPGRFIGAVPEFSYNVWTMDLLVGLLQLPRGSRNCAESLMREWLRALLRPLKKSCRCGLRPYHGAYVTPTFSNSSLGRIEEPQDSDSSLPSGVGRPCSILQSLTLSRVSEECLGPLAERSGAFHAQGLTGSNSALECSAD